MRALRSSVAPRPDDYVMAFRTKSNVARYVTELTTYEHVKGAVWRSVENLATGGFERRAGHGVAALGLAKIRQVPCCPVAKVVAAKVV